MRRIRADILINKQCSKGKTCEKCKILSKKQNSMTAQQLCWRPGFGQYEVAFFPGNYPSFSLYIAQKLIVIEFMHSHLRKQSVKDFIKEHTTEFTDTVLDVDISTGLEFNPMRVRTNVFNTKTDELLRQSVLTPTEADQSSQLVQQYSVQLGIWPLALHDVKEMCDTHIEEMISNPKYIEQATAGDVSQLPKEILEIVREYSSAKNVSLPQLTNSRRVPKY